MLSSGSFGALGMDESSDAGPSRRQVDAEEVDADWLKLIKTNHDVNVRVSDKVDLQGLPQECNLMVVSNLHDLLIVGGNQDVRIHRLSEIHKLLEDSPKDASPTSTPLQTLSLTSRPVWIRLAVGEERLVVALSEQRGVNVYRLTDIFSGNINPYHSFSNVPAHLLDVLSNPAPPSPSDQLARYTALLSPDALVIANLESCQLSAPLTGPFTSASWSAKGKQIALGIPDGRLLQYTPDGTAKAEIPPPPELEQGFQPMFIRWLENDLFLVGYANPSGQIDDPLDIYIIHRHQGSFTYTKFFDPNDVMGVPGRSSLYRQFASLRTWGQKTRHLGFMISGLASEIGILHGKTPAPAEIPQWEALILDETARGVMPAGKGGADDTSVIGLDIDLTTTKPVVRGIQGGIELDDLPPPPRVLAYSQEGVIISFNVQYPDAGAYTGMIKPVDLPSADGGDAAMVTGANTPVQAPEPTVPSAGQNAFGSSAFGQSAFGTSSTPQKTAFGSSAFGQSSTPVGSPFGSAPSSSTPAAFGSSAFGGTTTSTTPSTTPAKPATSAFGQSAFGQSSTPSAFGQSSALGAFGQSTPAFGSSTFGQSPKPAFGSSAFGSSPSSFGQTAFGQSGSPSAFGQSSQPAPSATSASAFGSTSQSDTPTSAFDQSAFGQPSKPAGFGQSAFGQPSQSSPSPSAFGSSSTPKGFGAFSTASKPASGFAGFGSSAFGQSSKPAGTSTSPFGNGGSVGAFGSASAFGSTFSTSSPGASAFSGFGQKASPSDTASASADSRTPTPQPPPDSTPTPASQPPAEQDDFGLGGFASALEPTKTVPGLEESPPTSPSKVSGKPPGLEDDTPPASPEFKPTSAFQPKAATTGSSFIKPATAFGGSPSGFGAFGSQSKAPSQVNAFGSSSQPNAFSSSPTATSSSTSPAAFGSSAFGKSSSPAAFGQSTFGQSSKPVTPAAASTSNAFSSSAASSGSITGGFGAFASKPTATADGKPTFGGFGGFASGGIGGKSAFGSAFGNKAASGTTSIFGSGSTKAAPATEAKLSTTDAARPASPIPATSTPSSPEKTPVVRDASPSISPPREETSPSDSASSEGEAKLEEASEDDGREGSPRDRRAPLEPESNVGAWRGRVIDEPGVVHVSSIRIVPESEANDAGTGDEEADAEENDAEAEGEYEDEDAEGEYEDEDDDWDEDEAEATDEDEGEDGAEEGATHARRASSSIEPELPSIEEEDETDEEPEEPDTRSGTKNAKSPPPWFAKSTPDATSSTSLFSRLGPPPAQPSFGAPAMKPSTSFNLKHAARTSSPLGTQPPATLDEAGSTTPPESPAKPLPKSGNFFGEPGKPGSGLGLGKPPGISAPTPTSGKLPFSFSSAAKAGPMPSAPVKSEPSPPPIPTTFTIPARSKPSVDLPNRNNGQKSMSAVLERMILEMSDDIASIKAHSKVNADYHARFSIPGFAKITSSTLSTHPAIPFSSLSDIPDIVNEFSASLKGIDEQNALALEKLAELQSRSMKNDLKTGQVDRYLEAKNDPNLAAKLRNDLTDEQASRRDALREMIDDIGARMAALEHSVDILQRRLNPPQPNPKDGPTLQEVQESYRKVRAALRDQEENIDDLADRISSIRFTTPPRSVTREMSGTPGPLARRPRYSSVTPSRATPEFVVPLHIVQEVQNAHSRREELTSRLKEVKSTRMVDASSLSKPRKREPVNMDQLPLPGSYNPEPDTKPSLESNPSLENDDKTLSEMPSGSQTADSAIAPALSFSGISFNLDPGAASAPSSRAGGSSRGGVGSRRTHQHAPKLQTIGTAKPTSEAAATPFGSFELPTTTEKKDGAPSGFFSFSGFGK